MRPELHDLLPVAKEAYQTEIFEFTKVIWENLHEYTEEALVRKAMNLNEEENSKFIPQNDDSFVSLVCTNNFDLYSGDGKYYTEYHGNIKRDGINNVFNRALKSNTYSREQAYFSVNTLAISTTDLAKKRGNPESKKIYFGGLYELRDRWLDLEFSNYRRC